MEFIIIFVKEFGIFICESLVIGYFGREVLERGIRVYDLVKGYLKGV